LADWASARGLEVSADSAGNLLLRKPASAGFETHPGVVLQAHLDMVCQANADTEHDFDKDPIECVVRDGWLMAERTTLGADNGIGVALALAALEDEALVHPPLEVLFTVDEEMGMGGANGLAPGWMRGTRMLNLDTEEWGEIYLGCAGGADIVVSRSCAVEEAPADYRWRKIAVTGLLGGHSGCDIHLGRGNANKLLVRVLRRLEKAGPIRLAAFSGGTARNALPREARADIALPPALDDASVRALLIDLETLFREELGGVDDGVRVTMAESSSALVLSAGDQGRLLSVLHAAPHGVKRMSATVPGVVETSNNLGVMALAEGGFSATLMVRSLRESGTEELAAEIVDLFALGGCKVAVDGAYPGWTPNPKSSLLALCQDVFRREFRTEPAVKVIHAGLECGIIGAKYEGIDTISFGPTIRGAQAPGEKVEIASVEQTWRLLKALLAAL
jgi:dipeptidase D